MKNSITDFPDHASRWRQCFMKLTRIVVYDDRRRLVLIPDRTSAENERDELKRRHGAAMIAANISKNGKGKTGTYTLAYTLREFRAEDLF